MTDYPRTWQEFEAQFPTEQTCWDRLERLRWPEGFQCPRCGHREAWPLRQGVWRCQACRVKISVRAGTVFQDSPLPLRVWFRAIWAVTNQKAGINALGLQRSLGLGSYRTAWLLLHKLREAMVRPGREALAGRVEVDETYVGGEEVGVRGRQTFKKALVVVAVECRGRGMGRIRLQRIPEATWSVLLRFVVHQVERGSRVVTDGLPAYGGVARAGYRHEVVDAGRGLPRVHRVVALLKRWLLGTHQGAVSLAHLDAYLEEYTFRFNRRTSRYRGKLFLRVLQQAIIRPPTTYRERIQHVRGRKPKRDPTSGGRAH